MYWGGVNVAEASEQAQRTNYSEAQNQNIDNFKKETATKSQISSQDTNTNANPENNTNPTEESPSKKETLDDFINNEGIGSLFDVDKINADAKEKLNANGEENEEVLELAEEKTPNSQGDGETNDQPAEENQANQETEPNYAEDEANIKDASDSERYRSTQMEQGAGTTDTTEDTPEMDYKDGLRYKTLEPSSTSEDQKQWGIEIEIDKEKGQRTYTDISFTNSGLLGGVLDNGSTPAKNVGDKLAEGFKDPNYKADANIEVTPSGRQRNVNLEATEDDLNHINNKGNSNTAMAWEGKYKKDNPNGLKATGGNNAAFSFTVNPWPNENDKLSLIKLNGTHDKKEFVKGQEITTNVQVENLDENARERLVGQVYNPITGEVVEGAKAYINDEGKVVVKMPEGAVNEDGTINENSVFYKDPKYKGIQNLEVKFFARPRTADEFRAIVTNNGAGYYTETGAGTKKINHDGKEVEVDLQGIDRYDHYNLIGGFKINLDDTRYYDQGFVNEEKVKAEDHTFNDVKAGIEYEIKGIDEATQKDENLPKITGDNPKTAEEMQAAVDRGEASASIDQNFIDKQNDKLNPDDKWVIKPSKDGDVSNFKVIAPKTSKPGDHFSVPVKYTYTNGSIDIHWFHFVVQETENPENDVPSYNARAGFEGTKLTSSPKFEESEEGKSKPTDYILEKNTYTDENGNTWTVAIDEDGKVTTTVPDNNIKGGESIEVPVKVEYTDGEGNKKYEYKTVQFFAIPNEDQPEYKTQTKEEKKSIIPFETIVEYDENLDEGKLVETQEGIKGELTTTFIQDTLNGKKGIFQEDGTFKEGDSKIEAKVTKTPQPRIIKIGTKPASTTVTIPKGIEYELDYSRKDGAPELVEEGNDGVVTVTTKRDPDTGLITMEQTVTTNVKNKKVKIPAGTEGTHKYIEDIPFKYEIEYDENLNAGEYVIDVPGQAGKRTTTWNIKNSKIDGDPTVETIDPINAKIRVGKKPNDNMCPIPDPTPDPDQPDKPVDPEKPVTPEEPDKPDTPDTPDPEKPEDPGTPEKPENPETPEIPENPETPEIPDNPEKPGIPEKPENSEEPARPDKPNEPSDKESPERPDSPKENLKEEKKEETIKVKQSKDKSKNPKTGIGSVAPIFTSMGISIAGLMATRKKKKEDE